MTVANYEENLKAITEYIENSWSNWWIEQYVSPSRRDNIQHLEWAIRRGMEEHIEQLTQEKCHLETVQGGQYVHHLE
tara:strand:+ start:1779 stop:2009 length:231 start_codon:yes stop_codon:yes gene_type:complete